MDIKFYDDNERNNQEAGHAMIGKIRLEFYREASTQTPTHL